MVQKFWLRIFTCFRLFFIIRTLEPSIRYYGLRNNSGVGSIKLPSGLNAEIAPKTAAAVLSSTPHKNGEISEPKKESELQEEPVDEGKLVGHELIKPEQTGILPEALQSQYKFARVCTLCFIQRKVHQLKILFYQ